MHMGQAGQAGTFFWCSGSVKEPDRRRVSSSRALAIASASSLDTCSRQAGVLLEFQGTGKIDWGMGSQPQRPIHELGALHSTAA